jgi:hypothetical protein
VDTTLEMIAYGLALRPVQTFAVAVFLLHGIAAILRDSRSGRPALEKQVARVADALARRRVAA